MDRWGIQMEKIDRTSAASLLSQQVTGARYFFLNLAPPPREPLVLVMGGREQCNPDYAIRRHGFPFYVLEYVVSGHGTVRLDHRRHTLGPGMVFAYAPTAHCEIHTDPSDPRVKYFLSFAGTAVTPRLKRCGVSLNGTRQLAAHAEVTSVLEDLVREGQRSGALAPRICAALFELLLLKIEDTSTLAPQSIRTPGFPDWRGTTSTRLASPAR